MATAISGLLVARSSIAIVAAATVEADTIDFDLGPDQAVQIVAVKHMWGRAQLSTTTSLINAEAFATLHAEEGTLEDPAFDVDSTDRDTEIFHGSVAVSFTGDDSGAAQGGMAGSSSVMSEAIEHMPKGLIFVSNIQHRLETKLMDDAISIYLVYYEYVRLAGNELVRAVLRGR